MAESGNTEERPLGACEAEIDRRIVEGYARVPPEQIWGEDGVKQLAEAEPW